MTIKKIIALFLTSICFASLLFLVGCSSSSTKGDAYNPDESKQFVVGFDESYPPYGFVGEDGKHTGFDLDLAQMVADKNGWELKLEPINWDSKDALIQSGSISCIWNGFTIEGREDKYAFTKPYMLNKQVIVVPKDSGISSYEDLADKTVITQVNSAALNVLEGDKKDLKDSFASLDTIADYNSAFMQLNSGVVDAVACDSSIADYQLAASDKYKVLDEELSSEHYGVGFDKNNQALADKVSATLSELNKEGKVEELCKKYEQYGLTYDNWILE